MSRSTSLWICLLAACSAGEGVALRARPLDAGMPSVPDACVLPVEPAPTLAEPTPNPDPTAHRYFTIRVRDAEGAPIAGAELETVHHVVYTSDRNGVVAFYEPGLMGGDVFFTPRREGYSYAADGFGFSGRALKAVEGGEGSLTLDRTGDPPTIERDDANTRAVASPVPTECFAVRVVDQASKRGVPLVFLDAPTQRYVTDSQGFTALCEPDLLGKPLRLGISSHGYSYPPRELELTPVAGGGVRVELVRLNLAERLFRSTGAGIYRDSVLLGLSTPGPSIRGGVVAQDAVAVGQVGDKQLWIWGTTDRPSYPLGNFNGCGATTTRDYDPTLPLDYAYISGDNGFCRALTNNLAPTQYPTWLTAMFNATDDSGAQQLFAVYAKPDGMLAVQGRGLLRFDAAQQNFVDTELRFPLGDYRAPDGQPVRATQGNDTYLYFPSQVRVPARESALRDLARYESVTVQSDLRDTRTGVSITSYGGAGQGYSSYRQRFVRVFSQLGGSASFLGEVWYAEADTPLGPWVYTQKILTHDRYTFYGAWIHDRLVQHGRYLMFEGTYTDALAGDDVPRTPRYNRNQLMHQLDLEQPDLALPVAVYGEKFYTKSTLPVGTPPLAPAFFAPDRQAPGTVPISWSGPDCAPRSLQIGTSTPPLFYAYAADDPTRPAHLVPLPSAPFAYVWPATNATALPVADFLGPLRADAGPDQCVVAGDVLLDAGASTAPAGTRFAWSRHGDPCTRSEGSTWRVALPVGLHAFELEIEDAQGNRSRDSVIVQAR